MVLKSFWNFKNTGEPIMVGSPTARGFICHLLVDNLLSGVILETSRVEYRAYIDGSVLKVVQFPH